MIAIDTNILVRLITDEPPEQAERASAALKQGGIFVPLTVVLETDWVLRSRIGLSPAQAIAAIRAVCRLPFVHMEHGPRLSKALAWAQDGMDFADALHLASAEACDALLSFDRKLARRAGRLNAEPAVVEP